MKTALPAALLAALLVVPVSAADWLQEGGDAARKGASVDPGPAWPDIALSHEYPSTLPAERLPYRPPPPLVLDGIAYVMARNETFDAVGSQATAGYVSRIHALDLATGQTRTVLELPAIVQTFVGDGQNWYVVARSMVLAYSQDWSQRLWELPLPLHQADQMMPGNTGADCGQAAFDGGVLFVACTPNVGVTVQAFAVDVATRTIKWDEVRTGKSDLPPLDDNDPLNSGGAVEPYWQGTMEEATVRGVTVADGHVVVTWHGDLCQSGGDPQYLPGPCPTAWEYWVLDRGTGEHIWMHGGTLLESQRYDVAANGQTVRIQGRLPPLATVAHDSLYGEYYERLIRRDLETGSLVDEWSLEDPGDSYGDPGSGIAVDGGNLYTTGPATLARRDATSGREIWAFTLPAEERWNAGQPVVAGGRVFAAAESRTNFLRGSLYCLDTGTGDLLWRHDTAGVLRFAVSDGLVVAQSYGPDTTRIEVLGDTEASIRLDLRVVTRYPAAGELVHVTLDASPGALGPATMFRADWGDASEPEDWTATPVVTHRYRANDEYTARFYTSNGNQTTSMATTFFVGEKDPAITIWNAPFHSEFQETSFFLLGLLATALLAAFGVLRSGRKRRIFNRELHALESDHDDLRSDAARHEEMLRMRRARVRALFLDRRLEDAHSSFLVTRIDEMRHGSRMAEVDERLDFLPHGMFKALQEVLRDARVSGFERKQFLEAVAREKRLTPTQKGEVRSVVEAWFARDTEVRP